MTATEKCRLYLAIVAIGCLVAHQSFAQLIGPVGGGDIAGIVTQAGTWAMQIVRAVAVLIVIGGFIMFSVARHHWAGGIVMLVGLAGALKADLIVSTLFGA